MSDALSPLPGDPSALASAAARLGGTAAALAGEGACFHEGARVATLAVMRSDAAFRLGALHDGLRGIEAEYARVQRSGTDVAAGLEEHARAWHRVEDELEELRSRVSRAERDAHESGADGSSEDATQAHERARRTRAEAEEQGARAKAELLHQRDGLVAGVRARVAGYDPSWAEVPPAAIRHAVLETGPLARAPARLADGSMTVQDAWSVLDDAYAEVADDDSRAWRSSATYQALGGLEQFQRLLVGSITDTGQVLAHPVDALEGAARLVWGLQNDPLHTVPPLVHAVVDPYVADWRAGEYGRAVGRGLEAAFEVALGGKGITKGLHGARDGEALDRVAETVAVARRMHRATRLRALGTRLPGTSTWQFSSEQVLARAMADPVPGSTYRVHHEGLPTDYVFGNHGELVVVRGPVTLLRTDVPVPPAEAREMVGRLDANGWEGVPDAKGGGRWGNEPGSQEDAARLPAFEASGSAITFKEFDVARRRRQGRGTMRLVRGSDGRVWYTDDHYKTFVRLR